MIETLSQDSLERAAELIWQADALLVTAGVGMGIWSADEFEPEVDVEKCLLLNEIPRCPYCGGTARPNVLMQRDRQWLENRQADQAARLSAWLAKVNNLVVVEVGAGDSTSALRGFSSLIVHDFSARMVRINPRDFSVPTKLDVGLGSGAKFALTEIDRLMQAGWS